MIILNKKAQISIEYLILTGFILLVVIVPAIIFLTSLANKSVYGSVNTQRANSLGEGLVNNAKQMYYLGLYSKKIVEYDMPQNVKSMFMVKLDDGVEVYYYISIIIDDGKETQKHFFASDVPLMSDPSSDYVSSSFGTSSPYIPECSTAVCDFYYFTDSAIRPGKKKFKIETILDTSANPSEVKASIIPILD
ncbi:hypothetical protein AYK26_06885 [Euryarchaeota archaeon SM23-78]|nr:MAG: hypothetical protein AYK26_06885 [Euryarchaeota archaeon SM23-78]MBW3000388.1 hypothetical protein [Candidatus Woesearchaeota archaeon]